MSEISPLDPLDFPPKEIVEHALALKDYFDSRGIKSWSIAGVTNVVPSPIKADDGLAQDMRRALSRLLSGTGNIRYRDGSDPDIVFMRCQNLILGLDPNDIPDTANGYICERLRYGRSEAPSLYLKAETPLQVTTKEADALCFVGDGDAKSVCARLNNTAYPWIRWVVRLVGVETKL